MGCELGIRVTNATSPTRSGAGPSGQQERQHPRRRRWGTALALGTVAAALTTVVPPPAPAGAQTPPFDYEDSTTIDVQGTPAMVDLDGTGSAYQPNPRLWDVTLTTPSIFVPGTNPPPTINPVRIPLTVRIYLPAGYDHDRTTGYPVLYLLHGGGGSSRDWSRPEQLANDSCLSGIGSGSDNGGDIVDTLAGTPFPGITVMVEGGCAGWYTDWYGRTNGHFSPDWETFHTRQLIPWIDANLRTDATREGRAIAGLSMGGLGAMRYAARHDDLFSAVGSFSGAVEMRDAQVQATVDQSMQGLPFGYGAAVDDHGLFQSEYRVDTNRVQTVFGPSTAPVPPESRRGWPALNPVELARSGELDGYAGKLALYSGESVQANDGGEEVIAVLNNALHDALADRGVSHRYCRGFGTHQWPYWRNDLRDFVHHVYGTTPATCTANGQNTPATNDDWVLVP